MTAVYFWFSIVNPLLFLFLAMLTFVGPIPYFWIGPAIWFLLSMFSASVSILSVKLKLGIKETAA